MMETGCDIVFAVGKFRWIFCVVHVGHVGILDGCVNVVYIALGCLACVFESFRSCLFGACTFISCDSSMLTSGQ